MINQSYFVFIKCDHQNDIFDIGVLENIFHDAFNVFRSSRQVVAKEAMKCCKLVYFEFGYSLEYAKRRIRFLKSLSASKRRSLIERHNPLWVDLPKEWRAELKS